jgi:hypothetical protein
MRLLVSIVTLGFLLLPAPAHAQSESAGVVGDAAIEAAAEGRCATALRLLGTLPRSQRHEVAAAPAVRACRRDAAPDDDEARDARTLSLQATAGTWTAMALGALLTRSGSAEDLGDALLLGGAIGSMVAPALGHWSRGNGWTRGMTIRTLALVGGGVAGFGVVAMMAGGCDHDSDCGDDELSIVAIAAGGLYVLGTIDDLVTAGRPRRREPRWQVTPTVRSAPAGPVAGLAAAGRF